MDSSSGKFIANLAKTYPSLQRMSKLFKDMATICPHPYGAILNSVIPHVGLQGTFHLLAFLLGILFASFIVPQTVSISGNSIDRTCCICLCIQNLLPFRRHWGVNDNSVAASSVNGDNSTLMASNDVCCGTNFICQLRCRWF